jgi:NAD(P)-dependent dehydrogenase (short-subunit alcohol dehydrogenase family)
MSLDDFRMVMEVHLMGAVHCTKGVWALMRQQNYGRIVMTTSSSGLYGNFGQSNYGAAKLALVGLMQTLGLEGAKYNIRVNCLAPTAATRMLEGLMSREMLELLEPAAVSPALLALIGEDAPNRTILCAGAGGVERANITLTQGIFVGHADDAPEQILSRLEEISDRTGDLVPDAGPVQGANELKKAARQRTDGGRL